MYEFIHTQIPKYPIAEKCRVLGVTKQGYYHWKRSRNKPYKHAGLLALVHAVLEEDPENKGNYGSNRVFLRLQQEEYGYTGSYSTVYRVMKAHGLLQKKKRNPSSMTKEDYQAQKKRESEKPGFYSCCSKHQMDNRYH